MGLGGLAGAAALGVQTSQAQDKASGRKRVAILFDSWNHMMPALAREMARREHDLVLGDAADGLAEELSGLGANVEVVDEPEPPSLQLGVAQP